MNTPRVPPREVRDETCPTVEIETVFQISQQVREVGEVLTRKTNINLLPLLSAGDTLGTHE